MTTTYTAYNLRVVVRHDHSEDPDELADALRVQLIDLPLSDDLSAVVSCVSSITESPTAVAGYEKS